MTVQKGVLSFVGSKVLDFLLVTQVSCDRAMMPLNGTEGAPGERECYDSSRDNVSR
jgi:hypothetical protein